MFVRGFQYVTNAAIATITCRWYLEQREISARSWSLIVSPRVPVWRGLIWDPNRRSMGSEAPLLSESKNRHDYRSKGGTRATSFTSCWNPRNPIQAWPPCQPRPSGIFFLIWRETG